jgi:hypothetical protein
MPIWRAFAVPADVKDGAERGGIDVNLADIPETFTTPLEEPFETSDLRGPFQVGHDRA